jgi:hypothetical protein
MIVVIYFVLNDCFVDKSSNLQINMKFESLQTLKRSSPKEHESKMTLFSFLFRMRWWCWHLERHFYFTKCWSYTIFKKENFKNFKSSNSRGLNNWFTILLKSFFLFEESWALKKYSFWTLFEINFNISEHN